MVGGIADHLKCPTADVDAQHKNSERDLEAKTPGDSLDANRAPIGGEGECQDEHHQQAEKSGKSPHSFSPFFDGRDARRPTITYFPITRRTRAFFGGAFVVTTKLFSSKDRA